MNCRLRFVVCLVIGVASISGLGMAQEPIVPSDSQASEIENRYLPPQPSILLVIQPRSLLVGDYAEWMPIEVISAAGQQYLGFDPMTLESAVLFCGKLELENPPLVGGIFRFVDDSVQLRLPGVEPEVEDGRVTYRGLPIPMVVQQAAPRTFLLAPEEALPDLLAAQNTEAPTIELMRQRPPQGLFDLYADLASNREVVDNVVAEMRADIPPQFHFLLEIPNLISSLEIHQETSASMTTRIVMNTSNAEDRERFEQILDAGITMARMALQPEFEKSFDQDDPTQAALLAYYLRIFDRIAAGWKPQATETQVVYEFSNGVASTGVLLGLLLPAIQQAREAARTVESTNQLKQLGLAVINYHETHGHFPVGIRDPQGRPLLSWRVEILPYLDEQDLYEQFHLDEPWNSDHNFELIQQMPAVFRHPSFELESGLTVYQAVAGRQQVFSGLLVNFSDILDGASNTAMLVETNPESAAVWTGPYDSRISEDDPMAEMRGGRPQGFAVLMVDGSVRNVSYEFGEAYWWAMTTTGGGEAIPFEDEE